MHSQRPPSRKSSDSQVSNRNKDKKNVTVQPGQGHKEQEPKGNI